MSEFPVLVSEKALAQLRRVVAKDGRSNVFLRIGLKGGGCSGLEYVLKLDDKPRETDLSAKWGELEVRCDPKSAKFLVGSTLEYTGNLIGGGFAFENPNAARKCGCGTSFTPKSSA